MEDIMNVPVEEFTSLSPVTIDLNADLKEGFLKMKENGIRHLPVVEDNNVVGIVSERDILANYSAHWAQHLRIKNVMSTSILTAYVNDSLGEVAYRLSKEKKGSAIVLDLEGKLYGIFTTTDALNALVEILSPNLEMSFAHDTTQSKELG
jgi:acetoin utilization protein AcuB